MLRRALIPVLLLTAMSVAADKDKPPALPFVENDYEKALAQAKSAGRPLFVEVWAPW